MGEAILFFVWGSITGAWVWSRLDAKFERKAAKVDEARKILGDAYNGCKTGMTFAPDMNVFVTKTIMIDDAPFLLTLRPKKEDQSHD